jgi:hypothetical protein
MTLVCLAIGAAHELVERGVAIGCIFLLTSPRPRTVSPAPIGRMMVREKER